MSARRPRKAARPRPTAELAQLIHRQHILRSLDILIRGGNAPFLSKRMRAEAARARDDARHWTGDPGIQGFGVSRRTVAGRRTGDLALKVYVDKKRPKGELASSAPRVVRLPGVDVPVLVDVEEIGKARFQVAPRLRPAGGGAAIGHVPGGTGTFGCLVRRRADPAALFLLSNAHVIAPFGTATPGDAIVQPGMDDGASSTQDVIASLELFSAFTDSAEDDFPNVIDAAVARVADPAQVTARIRGLGFPRGVSNVIHEGMTVRLSGAVSEPAVSSIVRDPAFHLRVEYSKSDGSPWLLGFSHLVSCDRFTEAGDSGAAILDEDGNIVGLHMGATDSVSFFCRIATVFQPDAFDLDLVAEDGGPSHPPSSGAAAATLPPIGSRATAIDTLARTAWGEARGEGDPGMQAIAAVVINRTHFAPKWGATVEAVCTKPKQFSCWNASDPNRSQLLAVTASNAHFARCLEIGAQAVDGRLPDPTNGATHYYADTIAPPAWAVGAPCATIGHHLFFKNIA